ncbi:hypothetical protein D6T64_19400 [Cryobacterium melibiosiphilum]|uniref:DUF4232 domain-containing protein n=1 Tax=Cryobacterium melibiosiphilum TaxID=995039 RepID=A0A3A5MH24_9MICO|nr:hypothetical protein [Cryobacterium melibiosiphilum]RJT85111.1 hypothetical protein D6T64_19400 [Cryobacterium melibiosiphilum]
MSTIKHPVGRQSSKVYRRRRLVVGIGLLAVLVIIFFLVVRPGASSGESNSGSPAAGSAAATDTATDAAATPVPEPSAVDGAPCDPGQVQVEAVTDAVRYEAGQQPQLSLSLTNTGTNACLINAGTAAQVFTITSGAETYWTSTDCQSESSDSQVTLKPGIVVSSSTPIAWDRTRSAVDTCDAVTRDGAPAGGASYNLSVTVDGITSASAKQILLF